MPDSLLKRGNIIVMWFYKHIQTVSPPVNELYMGEGEVPHLSVELPLPLAVDAHLGHLDDVTNL